MYNVKGPSKIVAKTAQRGVTKTIDSFRDNTRNRLFENDDNYIQDSRPVFSSASKRGIISQTLIQEDQQYITPEHEEIVNFVNDAWKAVCTEIHQDSGGNFVKNKERIFYYEDDPCPQLQNFKPFDLESWWGKRLYTFITKSIDAQS